jgi:hypothetical protein
MRMTNLSLLCAALLAANAFARLPPPSDEEKAKAAEAAAKAAWSAKIGSYQLCRAQNRAVADYQAQMKKVGKSVQSVAVATAACAEPRPYSDTSAKAKPVEAAGAHSPPAMATSPPSTAAPSAVTNPTAKN